MHFTLYIIFTFILTFYQKETCWGVCCYKTMSEREKPYTSVGAGGDPSLSQLDNTEVEDSRPMTYQELRNLSLAINMLTGPGLGRVVDIIRTHQPSDIPENDDGFEIDFEKLNPTTLWALERFVRSIVPSVYDKDENYEL